MEDWAKYLEIAQRFEKKARFEDREDLRHDIIVRGWQKLPKETGMSLLDVSSN